MKRVVWQGSSRAVVRGFPVKSRKEAGRQLLRLQLGLEPIDWRPMSAVGAGVREIRFRYQGQYRIIYVASEGDAVVVLHAFQKKTRRTPKRDVDLARRRFKEMGQ